LAYPIEGAAKKKKKEKKIGTGYVAKDKKQNAEIAQNVADGKVNPQYAIPQTVGTGVENAMEKLNMSRN
jgi:tyrosyl-tRNA synthetase